LLDASSAFRTRPASHRAAPAQPARPWWAPLIRDGIRPLLVLTDVLAVVVTAFVVRSSVPFLLLLGALGMVLFAMGGLYRSRLSLSLLDDLPAIAGRTAAAAALGLVLALSPIGSAVAPVLGQRFEAYVLGPVVLLATVALLRAASYTGVRWLRRRRTIAHRTVLVGTDPVARDLARVLQDRPVHGLVPAGYLEHGDAVREPIDLPVLGDPQDLARVLETHQIGVVVVSFGLGPEATLLDVVRLSHRHSCEVFVVPRLHELHPVSHGVEEVWGIPLVRLRRAAYRSPAWQLKRAMDVLLSGLALALLAPVLAACALAVRLDGGPGVIFRQMRVGVDGRQFEVLKFRSLQPVDSAESETRWNIGHDDRLSPVGRFLRSTSLDELPQLWNILRGDMSVVGPRPERPHFVAEFDQLYPSYGARHRVPSGLTGWAQVNGLRGDTSISDRARFDNYYIENWSMWLDLKILVRTVTSVLGAKGA
jgi:exopolysaccharide biosynthesis polyprenyl glycosylphosphotransferase